MAMAFERWVASWNMLRINARVDGIRVAPAMPRMARAAISISALCAYAAADRGQAEADRADQQQSAAAYPIAQRSHGQQQAGEHETVNVQNPELLGGGGVPGPG